VTKKEFRKALILACEPASKLPGYFSREMSVIDGCALDTKRRWVTLEQVASLIVGSCFTFAGTIDSEELENIEVLSKRFDLITKGE